MKDNLIGIIIVAIIFAGSIVYMAVKPPSVAYKKLPILGNHSLDTHYHGDKMHIDTLWHRVPDFSFIDQEGNVFTHQEVKKKIYVTDFFFSTCQTICPAMSGEMERVYQKFLNDDRVLIISHTVDPETDSPEQLSKYAQQFDAKAGKWIFLTGEKAELYQIARKGYMLEASIGSGGADDFIHTQNFALVDGKGRVRGIYDGLEPEEIDMMMKDMQSLLKEME